MKPRNAWFVAGFLAGCALGSTAVLLFAPVAGRDLVAALRNHFDQASRDAREAGRRAEADVLTRYKAARNSGTAGQIGATSGVYVAP